MGAQRAVRSWILGAIGYIMACNYFAYQQTLTPDFHTPEYIYVHTLCASKIDVNDFQWSHASRIYFYTQSVFTSLHYGPGTVHCGMAQISYRCSCEIAEWLTLFLEIWTAHYDYRLIRYQFYLAQSGLILHSFQQNFLHWYANYI